MSQAQKLPNAVERKIAEHIQLYLTDPEAAHVWDPAVIGVRGGPVRTLLLRTRGRKSGEARHVALQYFRPDGLYVVVASRGGMPAHPAWYLNLLEAPECEIQVAGLHARAVARTAQGEERKALWDIVSSEQPAYRHYQTKTEREIPVVVLDLADGV
jgi:deazaflavin-dependent oxidoreductase (nitroreductase family)